MCHFLARRPDYFDIHDPVAERAVAWIRVAPPTLMVDGKTLAEAVNTGALEGGVRVGVGVRTAPSVGVGVGDEKIGAVAVGVGLATAVEVLTGVGELVAVDVGVGVGVEIPDRPW